MGPDAAGWRNMKPTFLAHRSSSSTGQMHIWNQADGGWEDGAHTPVSSFSSRNLVNYNSFYRGTKYCFLARECRDLVPGVWLDGGTARSIN